MRGRRCNQRRLRRGQTRIQFEFPLAGEFVRAVQFFQLAIVHAARGSSRSDAFGAGTVQFRRGAKLDPARGRPRRDQLGARVDTAHQQFAFIAAVGESFERHQSVDTGKPDA